MKKLACILFLSCISGFANQEVIEVVGVNVNFEVQKCTFGAGDIMATCEDEGSINNDIFIPLGSCDTHDGIEECFGAWQGIRVRDEYEFYAVIVVVKKTENTNSTYTWTASVGSVLDTVDPAGAATLIPRDGNTLSDTLHLNGAIFWNNDCTSYFAPSLNLQPIAPLK